MVGHFDSNGDQLVSIIPQDAPGVKRCRTATHAKVEDTFDIWLPKYNMNRDSVQSGLAFLIAWLYNHHPRSIVGREAGLWRFPERSAGEHGRFVGSRTEALRRRRLHAWSLSQPGLYDGLRGDALLLRPLPAACGLFGASASVKSWQFIFLRSWVWKRLAPQGAKFTCSHIRLVEGDG